MYAWLARMSLRIGVKSPDPRVIAFTMTATASRIPRTPRGIAAATDLANDRAWEARYVAALVLGEAWPSLARYDTLIALAKDENSLVRAALARGVAHSSGLASEFATLDPSCVRIANHAQIRGDWDARIRV